jgi:ankyrin repeat protein
MMAVRGGFRETVQLLLDEDADPLAKNEAGDTALSWAEKAKQADIAQAIRAKIKSKK